MFLQGPRGQGGGRCSWSFLALCRLLPTFSQYTGRLRANHGRGVGMIKRFLFILYISAVFQLPLAQSVVGQSLRELVSDLFTFGSCDEVLCLDLVNGHGDHYSPNRVAQNGSMLFFFEDGFTNMLGTVPAPAMGGDLIGYEDENGDLVPTSFGPIFAERAETLGSGRFFVGLQTSAFSVSNFNGAPIDRVLFNFAHVNSHPLSAVDDPALAGRRLDERDIFQVRTALDLNVVVATTVLTAGLTSFMDIGVAIPVVRTRLKGTSNAQILALDPAYQHRFGGTSTDPVVHSSSSVNGTATGIGDVSARLKINLVGGTTRNQSPSTVGAAFMADVLLPTGDADEFLGLGAGMVRALAIVSGRWGGISPHLNAGYLLRQGDGRPDAFLGTIGLDARASDHMTFALDLISQWEHDVPKYTHPGPISLPRERAETFYDPQIMLEPSSIPGLNSPKKRRALDMAVGLKFRIGSDMLLVTNALVPVRNVGLRPDMMWTLALQSAFR